MELPPLAEGPLPDSRGPQAKPSKESVFGAIATGRELGRKIVRGVQAGAAAALAVTATTTTLKPPSSFSGCARIGSGHAQNGVHSCGQEQGGNGGSCGASQSAAKTDIAPTKHYQKAVSFFKSRSEMGTPLSGGSADKALEEDFIFITNRNMKASILRQGMLSALSAILTFAFCVVAVIIPSAHVAGAHQQAMEKAQHAHPASYWGTFLYGLPVFCLCLLGLASLAESKRAWDRDWDWNCGHKGAQRTAGKVCKAGQSPLHKNGDTQQFMTYVFHNIRVPFNAIVLGLGHLRSMADKNLSGMQITENKDLIQMMLDCAESMTSVLDDVTEMGQWEDGASKDFHIEEFDLFGLVKFLLWGLKDLLYQKQIRFCMSVDPLAKKVLSSNHVLGDKHRILQTLGNFLSNAVKFSPAEGKLELSIKCEEVIESDGSKSCHYGVQDDGGLEKAQDTTLCPCLRAEGLRKHPSMPSSFHTCGSQGRLAKVLITVTDAGNGISPQEQEKLFEPYSFVSSGWVQVAGVSGLGLSLAKQFVEQAGGYIGVKSKEGEGSMFYFCLPYPLIPITHNLEVKDVWLDDFTSDNTKHFQVPPTSKDRDVENDAKVPTNSPPIDKGGKKVLLVEDTEINRIILRKVLQTLELNCEEAENGQVAVDLLKEGRTYDLILMDKEMPVMDGHEATRQIRLLGVKTPIVALTGNALQSDRKLFLEAGVDDFQTKPLSRDKLVQVLIRFGVEIPCV